MWSSVFMLFGSLMEQKPLKLTLFHYFKDDSCTVALIFKTWSIRVYAFLSNQTNLSWIWNSVLWNWELMQIVTLENRYLR